MRLLADENFNNAVVRGLLRILAHVDILTVQHAGLSGTKDPELLASADRHDRILVTHDIQSMRGHLTARLALGLSVPGIVTIPESMPIGRAISELHLFVERSDQHEWKKLDD